MTMTCNKPRRRFAIQRSVINLAVVLSAQYALGQAILRVDNDPKSPAINYLSWDTEGGEQKLNLLRLGSILRVRIGGQWLQNEQLKAVAESTGSLSRYRLAPAAD